MSYPQSVINVIDPKLRTSVV